MRQPAIRALLLSRNRGHRSSCCRRQLAYRCRILVFLLLALRVVAMVVAMVVVMVVVMVVCMRMTVSEL